MAARIKRIVQSGVLCNLRSLSFNFRPERNCSTSRITVKELFQSEYIGKRLLIKGWVRALRKQKENMFMDINDGSTFHKLQVILPASQAASDLTYGSAVEISGVLVASDHPGQPFELRPDVVNVVGTCNPLVLSFET